MYGRYLKLLRFYLLWGFYFIRFAVRRFYQQRGLQIASSLAYTALLSLVPLVTVVFGILGGLPYFSGLQGSVQSFISSNFMPAFGDTVWNHLNVFSSRASDLTITGIVILVLIALLLMATIENAFNIIWHVRSRRRPAARFLVYWTILTLGPLLAATGILAASYLFSLELFNQMGGVYGMREELISWLPFITAVFAFTLLYLLVPNCRVERRHALTGALLAALLFEGAKAGFRIYLKSVPTYQIIYGAIAVIPVFLIWVYISWVIVILGAHFTFCLSAFSLEAERRGSKDAEWTFLDAARVVRVLWTAQKQGLPVSAHECRRRGIDLPLHQINQIMERLVEFRWAHPSGAGAWLLSRDITGHTLMDLYRIFPDRNRLVEQALGKEAVRDRLDVLVSDYNRNLEDLLAVSLASFDAEGE